jgi:acyl carrier protein
VDGAQARDAIGRALTAVAPGLALDGVGPGEDLRAALDLDSLDFLTLVERLSDLTGVEVPEADYGRVRTMGELSSYLVSHAG